MRMDVTMVTISHEQTTDIAEREVLLDRAFGPKRRRKTAERLRERRLPAEGLALSIRADDGELAGHRAAVERRGGLRGSCPAARADRH